MAPMRMSLALGRDVSTALGATSHTSSATRPTTLRCQSDQTFYIQPNTIHFVFRERQSQTFALTGYIL